jgi:hypothetical protein
MLSSVFAARARRLRSRGENAGVLQEKSLEIERARFEAGVDTAFFVIQYQSYLAPVDGGGGSE